MKKVLIATTALTLSAGIAAADVKVSGSARFGLQYNGANATKTSLEKRMTLNIDGSTTADNGVTFGARVRLRSDEVAGSAVNGARVYARSGGLTVAVGNILGAIESMPNLYGPSVGLTGLGWSGLVTNIDRAGAAHNSNYFDWDAYDSRGIGAEGIEVIYSMGDFAGHVSYSSSKLNGGVAATKRLAAYGAYTFSGWTVALGVQDADTARNVQDKVVLTASGKIGDFGVGFGVAQNGKGPKGVGGKVTKYAINGSYTMGATTLSGYVATQNVLPVATGSKTSYGIGASYDMGGGARIVGGIERTTRKDTRADVGVAFNF
ncbi:porin [Gemmobacter nectariphilus]|uniref:porin n=1 Tax=Gemmobacter nectariphilus TaxID=220343 RepID=UPI0004205F98|nr:porin [Gemmobacter nectariphilus]